MRDGDREKKMTLFEHLDPALPEAVLPSGLQKIELGFCTCN